MSKAKVICLIVAASLVVAGLVLTVLALCLSGGNFGAFGTATYVTETHEITEEIRRISVTADTSDITILLAEDGICKVVCHEEPNLKHKVTVSDGTLTIQRVDERKWYEHISIGAESLSVTVYLTEQTYETLTVRNSTGDVTVSEDFTFDGVDISVSTGDVKNSASSAGATSIKTNTGDILLENVTAGSVKLSVTTGRITARQVTCEGDLSVTVSTGKAELTDVTCRSLTSGGSTGDLTLQNVIAAAAFSVTRDTGDVTFKGCDATEITVRTDTGDVSGTFLSDKIFFATSDTGRIEVPHSTVGGACKITTDTGDIRLTVTAP